MDVLELAGATREDWLERGGNPHAYWPAVMEFKTRMGLEITTLAIAYGVELSEKMIRELPRDLEQLPDPNSWPFK